MRLRSLRLLIEDYQKVRSDSFGFGIDHAGLHKFFDCSGFGVYPNISSAGTRALDKLTKYIMSTFLPSTGEWVDAEYDVEDDAVAVQKMRNLFAKRIAESNFYDEATKTLRRGIVFKRSFLDSPFSDSISFHSVESDNIYLSKDMVLANRRVYAEEILSGEDIRSSFKNLPEHFDRPDNNETDYVGNSIFTVISGIIPVSDRFFIDPIKEEGYTYKKVFFTVGGATGDFFLEPMDDSELYLRSIPIVSFDAGGGESLAMMALPHCVKLERYDLQMDEYGDLVTRPPMHVDNATLMRGTFNFKSRGLVATSGNEAVPSPIPTAGNLPFGLEEMREEKQDIREIFSLDLIAQANINSLSQYEVAANNLAVVNVIAPLITDFLERSLNYIVQRVHRLLVDNDAEYRKLASQVSGKIVIYGADRIKNRLQKRVDMGQFVQTIAPMAQIDPSSLHTINGDKFNRKAAHCFNMGDILNTPKETADIRKELAKQQIQQQQLEQDKLEAETANLQNPEDQNVG